MTSFKFHYRPPVAGETASGTLFIRIIHARKYRDIRRDYPVRPGEWDEALRRVVIPAGADIDRRERLVHIDASIRADLSRLESIVRTLSASGPYTVGEVVDAFQKTGNGNTVLSFACQVAGQLEADGRVRTARAYRSAAKSIVKFNHGRDLLLSEITGARLREYERHLLDCGLQMNTISFYMRNLRALYYRAVASKVITPPKPTPSKTSTRVSTKPAAVRWTAKRSTRLPDWKKSCLSRT